MTVVSTGDKFISAFAAFTLSNSFIINYFNYNGMEGIGADISTWCLYLLTIISLFSIIQDRKYWNSVLIMVALFLFLVMYERRVDLFGTVHEYDSTFLIHGIGGFLIGLTIKNVKLFTKYISILSSVYLLILITEPINHAILHMDEMLTGYLMTGLTINLVLAYYTVFNKNKLILFEAIISSVIIALFTARGCGVAIVLSWLCFYYLDRKKNNLHTGKTLFRLAILVLIGYVVFSSMAGRIISSGLELEEGSLLEKISSGYADSSNGRDEVWEIGVGLLLRSPLTGIGFGADRTVDVVFFVHNIILEICINFGIPLAIFILLLYWVTTLKGIKVAPYSVISFLIIAQILKTWVQLMFSSSYLHTMLPLMFIVGLSIHAKVKSKAILYE